MSPEIPLWTRSFSSLVETRDQTPHFTPLKHTQIHWERHNMTGVNLVINYLLFWGCWMSGTEWLVCYGNIFIFLKYTYLFLSIVIRHITRFQLYPPCTYVQTCVGVYLTYPQPSHDTPTSFELSSVRIMGLWPTVHFNKRPSLRSHCDF